MSEIITLLVKHVPDFITQSPELQKNYFKPYKPIATRFMQTAAMPGFVFIDFANRHAAEEAYKELKKIHFGLYFKQIQVEYAKPDPSGQKELPSSTPSESPEPIAPLQGIDYPSNPHLRYLYPDPTPEILTNITHAIGSVPRLYTQVLHLMNKMNLPPPFGPLVKHAVPTLRKRKEDALLSSDESELEEETPQDTSKEQEERVKEARQARIAAEKQRLALKKAKENQQIQQIQRQCLPLEQLTHLAAFKNYEPGEVSNRLYIKNLHKKTTEQELIQIYSVFSNDIKVNLMTKGRLRDQAFVTLPDENVAKLALQSTNGYVLHDRPMAVVFSKNRDKVQH
ncbi:hypothetical protein G6F70_005404 [Rhizopus microsporus]|uniref:RRM domain-containing protein n=2 Tax=Rhizopus TaxID=4842 RepID=A0A367JXL5_RHIAZ|nr:hypothetical protein G6F71_006096 [Rhizopus microsporus]RCH94673.1 hypothetical protein CU097_013155 [Rhizopus azygosporus]KAG1198900.1 hypothetical protein G6F70_005404 [Rhizopus microsporus]KAG1210675.1 hypothetical protein G6F69_005264 [Rhizopus microsporus]KAG1232491.1 hypothetical protein G6F67_004979 [Rhizopus microsporus]